MQSRIHSLFRLVRVANLVFILLTQILVFILLRSAPGLSGIDEAFILFLLATQLIASAGYIINDYFDVKIDAVNKPGKLVVGSSIPARWAMFMHLLFSSVAILLAFWIKWQLGVVFVLIGFLLWQYSAAFKRTYLIGNVVIALLMGLTILSVYVFDPSLDLDWVLFYASFAFLTGLIREIVKDVEDMEGDRIFGCRTLPIVKGFPYTRRILIGLTVILALLLISSLLLFASQGKWYFATYFLLLLFFPVIGFLQKLANSDTKETYKQLSFHIKGIMLLGVLSMIMKLWQ